LRVSLEIVVKKADVHVNVIRELKMIAFFEMVVVLEYFVCKIWFLWLSF